MSERYSFIKDVIISFWDTLIPNYIRCHLRIRKEKELKVLRNGDSTLSMLIIYDSWIHSGGILAFLRKRFNEVVPASRGDEKKWMTAYINARHSWLANHSDALLRKTVYRTKCLTEQVQNDNWGLEKQVNANGVIIK